MIVNFISKESWMNISPYFHQMAFSNKDFSLIENIDFACSLVNDDTTLGYCTFRVLDKTHVYMQYGGAVDLGAYLNFKAYLTLVEALKKEYMHITTLIKNDNVPMLKMAMKAGFRIVGIRFIKNEIYLEHSIEVNHGL